MIDIDIIGQLIPNPVTMIVQLTSTLVLFLCIKKFLWKSVENFLSKRSDKMQSELEESEKAKAAALADRQNALQQLETASSKSEQIVTAAVKEAKDEKKAILDQASRQAGDTLARAKEQIEAERRDMKDSMQKEMVEVAMDAAGKLIGQKSSEDMDREAVERFVKEAQGHGE